MRFAEWSQHVRRHLSPQDTTQSERSGLGLVIAFVVAIVALCAYWEPAREATNLRAPGVLGALALVVALTILRHMLPAPYRWETWQPQWFFLGNFAIGLLAASFTAFSSMPGAAAFSGFFLLTAAAHCSLVRASAQTPWYFGIIALQVAIALLVNHDASHVVLWAIVLPASLVAGLITGTSALDNDRKCDEIDAMRSALTAELLAHEEQEARALSSRLSDYLGVQHDLKSPLFVAQLEIEHVIESLEKRADNELADSAKSVLGALTRLSGLMSSANAALHGRSANTVAVDLAAVVERVKRTVAARFPGVAFDAAVDGTVMVNGGEDTLLRVFENVCLNACEGNGTQGARTVRVASTRIEDTIEVRVDDDGPGFKPDLLGAITPYATTKSNGTGLGLFTVARLVSASLGSLWRENRDGGGARVLIHLRAATDAPSAAIPFDDGASQTTASGVDDERDAAIAHTANA